MSCGGGARPDRQGSNRRRGVECRPMTTAARSLMEPPRSLRGRRHFCHRVGFDSRAKPKSIIAPQRAAAQRLPLAALAVRVDKPSKEEAACRPFRCPCHCLKADCRRQRSWRSRLRQLLTFALVQRRSQSGHPTRSFEGASLNPLHTRRAGHECRSAVVHNACGFTFDSLPKRWIHQRCNQTQK